jgi:hypothetical protein
LHSLARADRPNPEWIKLTSDRNGGQARAPVSRSACEKQALGDVGIYSLLLKLLTALLMRLA